MQVLVFDQPMCCSSGVCGPEVDPALVTFAADLSWLERQGVQVQRINPTHQPTLFAGNETVRHELQAHGSGCLPLVVVDQAVVSRGRFPSRRELAGWTNLPPCDEPAPAVTTGSLVTTALPIAASLPISSGSSAAVAAWAGLPVMTSGCCSLPVAATPAQGTSAGCCESP